MLRLSSLLPVVALVACGVEITVDGPVPLAVLDPGPDVGCPTTIAELSGSRLFRPGDSRLTADGLVLALKDRRRLGLYGDGRLLVSDGEPLCFPIALGVGAPRGHKRREGDRRTPEGWYRTSDKPWSSFANAVAVHYPNRRDARRAEEDGRIDRATRQRIEAALEAGRKPPQNTALGGQVLIHGGGAAVDWTAGCIALDDGDLLRLRDAMPGGLRTDLLILP